MRMASLALVSCVSKSIGWSLHTPVPWLNLIDDPFQSLPKILGATFPTKSACPRLVARMTYLQERTDITLLTSLPIRCGSLFESSIPINTSTLLAFHHYACCWRPFYHPQCSQSMNDVEKLDQPCSCTLVEVVIRVSRPFTLVLNVNLTIVPF